MSSLIHATQHSAPARAYCGMWIVDCLRCRNAERIDRFQAGVLCSYCQISIEIIWPAADMVHSIERLLLMRPIPYTQNWFPSETLTDLMIENGLHGIYDHLKAQELEPGLSLLTVDDERIHTDMLPIMVRQEFKAVGA